MVARKGETKFRKRSGKKKSAYKKAKANKKQATTAKKKSSRRRWFRLAFWKRTKSEKLSKDTKKGKAKKSKKRKAKKQKRSRRSILRSPRLWKSIVFFSVIVGVSLWLFWGIPFPTKLSTNEFPVSTKLFDRNGNLLFEIYADRRSTPVDLEEIPQHVKDATVAIEDKDFYKHYGVSVTGVIRAAYKTVFKQKLEGGSTLTQQLVKNSLLTPERTIKRKIREFALTMVVETIYTKNQILEIYLNQIPYGSTAYGIGAAAELYFGKSVQDLTLAEASLLAGLPAAPTRFSPFGARPELAKERQTAVLRRMVEDGYVSQEEMDKAQEEELDYAEVDVPAAPHFSLWVKDQLAEKYGDKMVEQGGLRVTTTLDLELQEFAQEAVATEVAELEAYNVGNGAAIVTRPRTGEILAMVGSKDFFAEDEDGKVNIVFRERQPGSSIKPLNYALGIRDERITASTPLADVPTCFNVTGQRPYCPTNYDFNVHGPIQARFALGNSYNIPAVRVLALNGIENFIDFATEMGITTWTNPDNYGLSLTLGGGEVRPYDMATAYGVFANQGVRIPLISILKVENWKGEVLEEVNPDEIDGDRIMGPEVPFIISDILSDNGARSATFGSGSLLNVRDHPEVSVKTGTTNELKDNWTIGYTGNAVVVVWVGNNDNEPMSRAASGSSGASAIWNTIMKEVLDKAESGRYDEEEEGHSQLFRPEGVVGATVCSDNGNVAPEGGCPTRFEYFLEGAVGSRLEWGTKDVQIDKTNGQLAHPELPPELIETQNRPFLLDPLGTLVCLDCPIASHSATISYPLPAREN